MKTCKIPAYTRKMKELISKITETSAVIEERRQAATLNLQDLNAVVCNSSCCTIHYSVHQVLQLPVVTESLSFHTYF